MRHRTPLTPLFSEETDGVYVCGLGVVVCVGHSFAAFRCCNFKTSVNEYGWKFHVDGTAKPSGKARDSLTSAAPGKGKCFYVDSDTLPFCNFARSGGLAGPLRVFVL